MLFFCLRCLEWCVQSFILDGCFRIHLSKVSVFVYNPILGGGSSSMICDITNRLDANPGQTISWGKRMGKEGGKHETHRSTPEAQSIHLLSVTAYPVRGHMEGASGHFITGLTYRGKQQGLALSGIRQQPRTVSPRRDNCLLSRVGRSTLKSCWASTCTSALADVNSVILHY